MKSFSRFLTIGFSFLLIFTTNGCSKNTSDSVTGTANGAWFTTTADACIGFMHSMMMGLLLIMKWRYIPILQCLYIRT